MRSTKLDFEKILSELGFDDKIRPELVIQTGHSGSINIVAISYDGRFVNYKKPGLISPSSYVFSVERRASKLVNGDWHSLYA